MKRAKDRYLINRTKYKDIKRYDHKQMEDLQTLRIIERIKARESPR